MERVAIGGAMLKTTVLALRHDTAVGAIQGQALAGTGRCRWDLHVAFTLSAMSLKQDTVSEALTSRRHASAAVHLSGEIVNSPALT